MSHAFKADGITDKGVRKLVRDAIKRGWSARWTGSCHVRLTHPSGAAITCSCSPSNRRAVTKVQADIARVENGAWQ